MKNGHFKSNLTTDKMILIVEGIELYTFLNFEHNTNIFLVYGSIFCIAKFPNCGSYEKIVSSKFLMVFPINFVRSIY